MTPTTAAVFFAILSLAALAGTVALSALLVRTRGMDTSAPVGGLQRVRADLARAALPVAWIIATVTTLGSLYFSEVAHYIPCALCWYQRIAMYPLVLLLGIATFRRDRAVRPYVIAQCGVGAAIATYHTFVQAFPPESGTSFCTVEAPCTTRYVWEFGFVSLPFMALTGFLFIITLMVVAGREEPVDRDDDREDDREDDDRAALRDETSAAAASSHPSLVPGAPR